MQQTEINITFPVIIGAQDYHEFMDYRDVLKDITGEPIKYIEIQSELYEIENFTGNKTDKDKLIFELTNKLSGLVDIKKLLKRNHTPYCAVFYI